MKSEPDGSDLFSFDGPEIRGWSQYQIDWKKEQKVTLKIVKEKQEHKGGGTVHTVTKIVGRDSFLKIHFLPLLKFLRGWIWVMLLNEALLAADSEIGHFYVSV